MAQNNEFVIEDGVLVDYTGIGGDVTVPEGVVRIEGGYYNGSAWTERGAFDYCNHLTGIVLPRSLEYVDEWTFADRKDLTSVFIPETVESIEPNAFSQCSGLKSVTLENPDISISEDAFSDCPSLVDFPVDAILSNGNFRMFGEKVPDAILNTFIEDFDKFLSRMTDSMIVTLLRLKNVWNDLSFSTQAELLMTHQNKSLAPIYCSYVSEPELYVEEIRNRLSIKQPVRVYNSVASFIILFQKTLSEDSIQALYEDLRGIKAASRAVKKMESQIPFL